MINFIRKNIKFIPVKNTVQPSVEVPMERIDIEVQSKKLHFVNVIQPIYYFSRVSGLMPFSINYDSNGNIQEPKVNKRDVLWFVTSICLYSAMVFIAGRNVNLPQSSDLSFGIMVSGIHAIKIVGLILTLIFIILEMCNRSNIMRILKSFTSFDNEVNKHIL